MANIIEVLKLEIAEIQSRITGIQNECSHPAAAVVKERFGDTGNYDPSSDKYWTEFHCTLCDKKWSKDGSH